MFLKQSLGGNAKTALICNVSMLNKHFEESFQTLQFAKRAKKIKNKAVSNIVLSVAELEKIIKDLKLEI